MDKLECCGCWPEIEDRPATAEDIADMQAQMSMVANDPNLVISTTHYFSEPCKCDCHRWNAEKTLEAPIEFYDEVGNKIEWPKYRPQRWNGTN